MGCSRCEHPIAIPALTSYVLLSASMILATIFGDQYALSSGLMTFGHGYSIVVDSGYGLALLWVPLAMYALLCLRACVTSAPSLMVNALRSEQIWPPKTPLGRTR